MKKTLGRVGASISAVALLAGGLVGVATPAVADRASGDDGTTLTGEDYSCDGTKQRLKDHPDKTKAALKAEVLADTKVKCPNFQGHFVLEKNGFGGPSVIGYGHLKDGQSFEDALAELNRRAIDISLVGHPSGLVRKGFGILRISKDTVQCPTCSSAPARHVCRVRTSAGVPMRGSSLWFFSQKWIKI